jgi:hypothetical protein
MTGSTILSTTSLPRAAKRLLVNSSYCSFTICSTLPITKLWKTKLSMIGIPVEVPEKEINKRRAATPEPATNCQNIFPANHPFERMNVSS